MCYYWTRSCYVVQSLKLRLTLCDPIDCSTPGFSVFMDAVIVHSDFGAQENKVCHSFPFSPSICHKVMRLNIITFIFWMLSTSLFTLLFDPHQEVVLVIKNLPANVRDRRHRLDPWVGRIPWRRKYQSDSSILPWEITWAKEPGGLQSMGSQRVRHV